MPLTSRLGITDLAAAFKPLLTEGRPSTCSRRARALILLLEQVSAELQARPAPIEL